MCMNILSLSRPIFICSIGKLSQTESKWAHFWRKVPCMKILIPGATLCFWWPIILLSYTRNHVTIHAKPSAAKPVEKQDSRVARYLSNLTLWPQTVDLVFYPPYKGQSGCMFQECPKRHVACWIQSASRCWKRSDKALELFQPVAWCLTWMNVFPYQQAWLFFKTFIWKRSDCFWCSDLISQQKVMELSSQTTGLFKKYPFPT